MLVRSGSDYNHDPLSFFSDDATSTFLPKVYGIDVQDLLTRFEGYSVAGGTLAGMASTYKQRVQAAKSELSAKLRMGLRECDCHCVLYSTTHRYENQVPSRVNPKQRCFIKHSSAI